MVAKSIHKYCTQLDSNINIHIIQKQAAIHTTTILNHFEKNQNFQGLSNPICNVGTMGSCDTLFLMVIPRKPITREVIT
uniref:SFRICE_040227 n=1 Tax=Spodoptera frugiperda TaxID=7108 RepID=A0A2H1VKP8_SPOFR